MLKEKLLKIGGRAVTRIKAKSPELCIAGGIVCVAAGVVLCCKATMEVDNIIDDHKQCMDYNRSELKDDKKTLQIETVRTYSGTALALGRVYAPGIGFTVMGVGFFLASYKILKIRNIALIGAYNTLETAFQNYRERIIEDHGEEYDYDVTHGIRRGYIEKETTDKKGKTKTEQVKVEDYDGKINSPYSKFFDESSKFWKKDSDSNLFFLKQQQEHANFMLNAQGSLFLNEVYDMLDIPRTKTGAVCGWVVDGDGDGYVDFGIFNENGSVADRRFVNGYEDVYLLDFNCDGVIYDKI